MTAKKVTRCVLVSDFNIDNLAGALGQLGIESVGTPFGQTAQVLLDASHPCWSAAHEAHVVVWTLPERVSAGFERLLAGERVPLSAMVEEARAFASMLEAAARRARAVLVPTWVLPAQRRGLGLLELRHELGASRALAHMSMALMDALERVPNAYLLDASRWMAAAGASASHPKLWFMAKVPFGPKVFAAAAGEIEAATQALAGATRKLVVCDLDNTLWGGIVGDDGWQNLQLGGHSPAGEAFVELQRGLKALSRRGVLLAIASKNEEAVALEAIERHPEMVLRREDFVAWRIDWNDKAQNIASLVEELNLGLQSVVFLDDNPVERARVRDMLPEVLVPEWPTDPMLYPKALAELTCFDTASLTEEDAERTQMYLAERQRRDLQQQVGSLDDWLMSLGVRVAVEPLGPANLTRTAQLFNKTNQMNLTTRRLTAEELQVWASGAGREVLVFRVGDRFGDSGLTGIASLEHDPASGTTHVVDWILSCRVMGKRVEQAICHVLTERARRAGTQRLVARYVPTAKNTPCLRFWRDASGFTTEPEDCFSWALEADYPLPPSVRLEDAHGTATGSAGPAVAEVF